MRIPPYMCVSKELEQMIISDDESAFAVPLDYISGFIDIVFLQAFGLLIS